MIHTIRLTDPGQPSRVYLAIGPVDSVIVKARILGHGVLKGGTVQVYRCDPDDMTGDESSTPLGHCTVHAATGDHEQDRDRRAHLRIRTS